MKRFLLICTLAMLTCVVSAANGMNVVPENDVGYSACIVNTPTFEAFNFTAVEAWQAPVELNMEVSTTSAQVICADSKLVKPAMMSEVLVQYQWPIINDVVIIKNCSAAYTNVTCSAREPITYSFMLTRTESI